MSIPQMIFFAVGMFTSFGCGSCIVTGKGPWQAFAVWLVGGLAGAVMMYLAITMRGASCQ